MHLQLTLFQIQISLCIRIYMSEMTVDDWLSFIWLFAALYKFNLVLTCDIHNIWQRVTFVELRYSRFNNNNNNKKQKEIHRENNKDHFIVCAFIICLAGAAMLLLYRYFILFSASLLISLCFSSLTICTFFFSFGFNEIQCTENMGKYGIVYSWAEVG